MSVLAGWFHKALDGLRERGGPPAVRATPAPVRAAAPRGELRARALRGSVWAMAGHLGGQAIRFGNNLALTYLIDKELLGLMGIVHVFLAGLYFLSDFGVGPALIHNARGDEPEFLDTAWTLHVCRGGVLWLLTLPLGPLLAWLYAGEPGAATLHWLVPTVGTTALIAGLHSTAVYRLNRHLHLRPVVLLDLGAQIAGCTVGLACAWFHPGIPALVAGVLVHQVVFTAGSHLLGTRNRFRWDREAGRAVIHFGRWIWLSTMLTWVAMQTDRLVMPKLIGFDGLAVYQVALMIASTVPEAVHMVGSKVLFPALSDFVRRRDPSLNARLQKARAAIVLPAVGALLTLSLFGELLVHLLYPRAFGDSGWMLRLLAAAAIPQALTASSWYAFFAIGRAKVPTLLQAAKVVVKVGAMVLGFRLGGARGVILGLVAAELLHYPFVACALRRHGLLNLRFDALVLAASALSVATGLWLW